jgi:glycine/serine hydroxymethyltransferase
MKEIAGIIGDVLSGSTDDAVIDRCRRRVDELVARFPAYPD